MAPDQASSHSSALVPHGQPSFTGLTPDQMRIGFQMMSQHPAAMQQFGVNPFSAKQLFSNFSQQFSNQFSNPFGAFGNAGNQQQQQQQRPLIEVFGNVKPKSPGTMEKST
eukprot:9312604-Pyramimonas_sp.AAC.1